MKLKVQSIVAAFAAFTLPAICQAQTPLPLTNPSFENANLFSLDNEPEGWHNQSNHLGVKRRSNTDLEQGLYPITARTGDKCVELRFNDTLGQGQGGYVDVTTDTLNYFAQGFPFIPYYDPAYNWEGGGIRVAGWYNIPADKAINDVVAGIKIRVKLSNATGGSSAQDAWAYEAGGITGHTNGQWRQIELVLSRSAIKRAVIDNSTQGTGGYFPLPPNPNRIKIELFRFNPDNTPTTGTIYWDDIEFTQFCAGDFNNDGVVDFFDYLDFVAAFSANDAAADFNGDGVIDFFDYLDFVGVFSQNC